MIAHRPVAVARRVAARALTLVAVAVVGIVGGACGQAAPDAEAASPAAAAVRDTATFSPEAVRLAGMVVAPAESLAWRDAWSAPARLVLDPATTHSLGAIAEGRVTRVLVRVGDQVRAGQLLATIHSHEMMEARRALAGAVAAHADATASLGIAETAAARATRLHAIRALATVDLERAQGELTRARTREADARAELARTRALREHLVGDGPVPAGVDADEVLVRAPAAGTVVALDARPGAVVLVGAPLVTVSRTTALMLTLQVPERALAAAQPGATVRFTVAAHPGRHFDARVMRVGPVVDSLSRTVEVQARVDAGTAALRAQMYASAELLGPAGMRTLVVPSSAIQSLDGDTVVIAARAHAGVRSRGTTIEPVRVRVGRRTAERAEILAGLAVGTPVVVEGAAIARAELLRRRGAE